jgi:hypothetical protein
MHMLRHESSQTKGCLFYLLVEMFPLIIQFSERFIISITDHRINIPPYYSYFLLSQED